MYLIHPELGDLSVTCRTRSSSVIGDRAVGKYGFLCAVKTFPAFSAGFSQPRSVTVMTGRALQTLLLVKTVSVGLTRGTE